MNSESEQGQALASRFNLAPRHLPALITPTGAPLRQPSLREVAQQAGLLRPLVTDDAAEVHADLTIIGAGPAGLAAAVRAPRASTRLFSKATLPAARPVRRR